MISPKQITHSTPPGWTGVEYGSICPFNADNSRILLVRRDHFGLYDGSGTFLKDLTIPASAEPRWSRSDPNTFYWIRGNRLIRTAGPTETIQHTFNEYPEYVGDQQNGITMCGEADISEDGDHLVFANGTRTEVFTYQISTDTKSKPIPTLGGLDGLKITASNQIIMSNDKGIWLVDQTATKRLTPVNGHAAVCRDNTGDDCLVWINANDPLPPSDHQNCIVKIRIADGKPTYLLNLNWSLAVDISACRSFALVSTYGNQASGQYANQILKVMLDGSGTEVLCDTGSVAISYNAQPKASLSRDGKRFVFSSNNGKTADPNYCDCFLGTIDSAPPPSTLKEIDFTGQDGKEWEWHFKVVDGKMTVRIFDKI